MTYTYHEKPYQDSNNQGFIPYDKAGTYDGEKQLIVEELKHVEQLRKRDNQNYLGIGLAVSGGGIRSAIFALGVLQLLAGKGWLQKVDYLSTVSGGGYIGSSLTWLLHRNWGIGKFGVSSDDFPYGSYRREKTSYDPENSAQDSSPEKKQKGNQTKAAMLRFLRQNGKYLTPGDGINLLSLVAVVLRGTFLSLFVHLPLLILLQLILYHAYIIRPHSEYPASWLYLTQLHIAGEKIPLNFSLTITLTLIVAATVASILYALSTYNLSSERKKRYSQRRRYEVAAAQMLVAIVAFTVFGTLPILHQLTEPAKNEMMPAAIGLVSTACGFISTVLMFFMSATPQTDATKRKPLFSLLVWLATILLLYGVLFLAYLMVYALFHPTGLILWAFYALWLTLAIIVGRFVNLNYISIHRYYRDRLMETFMPNVREVIENGGFAADGATAADAARLSSMCQPDKGAVGPYHIINANIVLVESYSKKFRGRGGDNFILSPQFCGSNATGWRATSEFMSDSMTLATAMAISGAAANPDTGVGGEGPTRNTVLSLLMSLLNIRLGYWAPNPDPEINKWQSGRQTGEKLNPLQGYRPNFFVPILTSTALAKVVSKLFALFRLPVNVENNFGKNEKNRFIELTDGGHFENLGLYELVRRMLPTIIVCDGGADPDSKFEDLANAIEKVRVDFGTVIEMDITPLIPNASIEARCGIPCANQGFVIGKIIYPNNTEGTLIYMKTTLTGAIPSDLIGYKKQHPSFPDQTTADQFFDEKQFEAYRELGYVIANELTTTFHLSSEGRLEQSNNKSLSGKK